MRERTGAIDEDGGTHVIVGVDEFLRGPAPTAPHVGATASLWAEAADGGFFAVASANLDEDPVLDVWSVSSVARSCGGRWIGAGVPCRHVDDLE